MGGQFYGYVTGTANLSCEAEAEPPPSFRWLDAENNPVQAGTVVNMQYKVQYSTVPYSACSTRVRTIANMQYRVVQSPVLSLKVKGHPIRCR